MKKLLILISISLILSCDWPFNTTKSEDDIFKLSLSHNIERVMPSAEVNLSWTEITIENFNKFMIEKRREKDSTWTLVDEIKDPFRLSYIDIITDDDDLTYRVGIVDDDGLTKWTDNSIEIPKTTKVIVPDEMSKIQDAVESELTDDQDTIFVKSGLHEYLEIIELHNKDVLIKSESGFENTTIKPLPGNQYSTITMSSGTVSGFTIEDAVAGFGSGGGITLTGTAKIDNCFITNNFSDVVGGGIYMGGYASVYNCIIDSNYASEGGSGIFINSGSGEIINNTIINNDVVFTGDCSNLIFRNNIVYNVNPALSGNFEYDTLNFTVDYSLFGYDIGYGSNLIVGDPHLMDYDSYELSPSSPCIDAGHPGEEYNDDDGTRNNIGAYGGPKNTK